MNISRISDSAAKKFPQKMFRALINNNNNNNNNNSLFHLELDYFYKSKENLNVQGAGYPE